MSLTLTDGGVALDGRWLVRGLDITIAPGQVVALVGPNGSGKTTALRLLAGLRAPTVGVASIDGVNLKSLDRRRLARSVAFVPQDTHVAFAFSVREVVAMGRHAHVARFAREGPADRRAVAQALETADVVHLADRAINELSGGERQRALLARSLATEAPHILLDEPTANLDIAHAIDVLALCRRLAGEGRAVGVALHDLNAALRFATDAVLLARGEVFRAGPVTQVVTPEAVRQVFDVRVERLEGSTAGPVLVFDRP